MDQGSSPANCSDTARPLCRNQRWKLKGQKSIGRGYVNSIHTKGEGVSFSYSVQGALTQFVGLSALGRGPQGNAKTFFRVPHVCGSWGKALFSPRSARVHEHSTVPVKQLRRAHVLVPKTREYLQEKKLESKGGENGRAIKPYLQLPVYEYSGARAMR